LAIDSRGQTVFSFSHIEGISLGAGEKVDEIAGGASGMGVDDFLSIFPPSPPPSGLTPTLVALFVTTWGVIFTVCSQTFTLL
jgi:hypothetical protein